MELFHNDSTKIENIKDDIIKLQRKYAKCNYNLKDFIISIGPDKKKLSKKNVNHILNKVCDIINCLGDKKWVEEENKQIIEDLCKLYELDSNKLYKKLLSVLKEKYLGMDVNFVIEMKQKLEKLSSLVQGKELRDALTECFTPLKTIKYERIRYLFTDIVKDKYIYTTQKVDPSCEHIIPKKLFKQERPMMSDMHHIFLAPTVTNNIRDRLKFGIIDKSEHFKTVDEQGKSKESHFVNKYTKNLFDPEPYSRGRIARACAYFFTTYPDLFPYLSEVIVLDYLKEWCIKYKPTKGELLRNYFIYQIQKNVNPFIIYPELAIHAYQNVQTKDMVKLKYKNKIAGHISNIDIEIELIKGCLSKYNEILEEHDDIVEASYMIIQIEKLRSSINRISDIVKPKNDYL